MQRCSAAVLWRDLVSSSTTQSAAMSDKPEPQDDPAGSESGRSQKSGKPQGKRSARLAGQKPTPQDPAPEESSSTPQAARSSASKKGKKLKEAQDEERQQPEAEPEQQQGPRATSAATTANG